MTATDAEQRPALEVADVIRQHGEAFLARSGSSLSHAQKKALHDLALCRTAALGGHVERCLDCGHDRIAYNSCRNRHCPKCQAQSRARWLERETKHLLPVEYHHVVFTLPAEFSELALANPAVVYGVLFQAASATLRDVAANPKHLGAQVGVLMVLHTWGQNLHHHPHVHCVVSGGGLSCNAAAVVDAEPRWVTCRPGFFLPVNILSLVYQGKFLDGLRQAFAAGRLKFPGTLTALRDDNVFDEWLKPLESKAWVVYSEPPFGGPEQVLKYLARYIHRVAISNHRLVKLEAGQVTFHYKDYADGRRTKTMTLAGEEFLRRFVQHVLPSGFVKVRHYGLLANRQREAKLALSRRLLMVVLLLTPWLKVGPGAEPMRERTCPQCGSKRLVRLPLLSAAEAGANGATADSS